VAATTRSRATIAPGRADEAGVRGQLRRSEVLLVSLSRWSGQGGDADDEHGEEGFGGWIDDGEGASRLRTRRRSAHQSRGLRRRSRSAQRFALHQRGDGHDPRRAHNPTVPGSALADTTSIGTSDRADNLGLEFSAEVACDLDETTCGRRQGPVSSPRQRDAAIVIALTEIPQVCSSIFPSCGVG